MFCRLHPPQRPHPSRGRCSPGPTAVLPMLLLWAPLQSWNVAPGLTSQPCGAAGISATEDSQIPNLFMATSKTSRKLPESSRHKNSVSFSKHLVSVFKTKFFEDFSDSLGAENTALRSYPYLILEKANTQWVRNKNHLISLQFWLAQCQLQNQDLWIGTLFPPYPSEIMTLWPCRQVIKSDNSPLLPVCYLFTKQIF